MMLSPRNTSDAAPVLRSAANHAEFEALIDILPVGIFALDGSQRVQTINPAALELIGCALVDAVGKTCTDLLQCSFCAAECATCRARDSGDVHRSFPAEIQRADGERRSVLIDAVPFGKDGVAVLLHDVTEWPGNVRELENVQNSVVRTRSDVITAVDLPRGPGHPVAMAPEERMRNALRRTGGCVTRAARLLGVHRTTLWRHMRESGISRDEFLLG